MYVYILFYDYNQNLTVWSSVYEYLGCFPVFIIVNSASTSIFLCLFPIVHVQEFLSVIYLGNELLGYSICECSTSWNTANVFTKMLEQINKLLILYVVNIHR